MWANSFLHFTGEYSACPAQSKCHDVEYQPKVALDPTKFLLFTTVLGSVVDLSGRMEILSKAKDPHCKSVFKTYQANSNKRVAYETTEEARFACTVSTLKKKIPMTYELVREGVGFDTSDNCNSKARMGQDLVAGRWRAGSMIREPAARGSITRFYVGCIGKKKCMVYARNGGQVNGMAARVRLEVVVVRVRVNQIFNPKRPNSLLYNGMGCIIYASKNARYTPG
jgi:hypothetical protein